MAQGGEVAGLVEATERLLRVVGDPLVDGFLALWPEAGALRTTQAKALPVLRWLEPTCLAGAPGAGDVLARLLALAPRLAWAQTYTAEDFGPAFLERYGWVELIGRRGAVASELVAVGFLLLGPHVTYPSHSHDAEEVYVVLSGTAGWQRGAEDWRERAAGTVIHHPGGMPHAMRTAGEPLLALYLWRGGDLAQKSRIG